MVQSFLDPEKGEGHKWQKKLEEYNEGVDSYIEEWWCESRSVPASLSLESRVEEGYRSLKD